MKCVVLVIFDMPAIFSMQVKNFMNQEIVATNLCTFCIFKEFSYISIRLTEERKKFCAINEYATALLKQTLNPHVDKLTVRILSVTSLPLLIVFA